MQLTKLECDQTLDALQKEYHKRYLAREGLIKNIGVTGTVKTDLTDVKLILSESIALKKLDELITELRGVEHDF